MPWIKVDDGFDEHPKFLSLPPEATAVWFHCLAYCNRNLTDGFIPEAKAALETFRCLQHRKDAPNPVEALITAGLWERTEGGYQFHDYLKYQPSRAQVLLERELRRSAKVAGGLSRALNAARENGRFTSRPPAEPPAEPPAADQQATSPVPVPVSVPKKEKRDTGTASRPRWVPPSREEVRDYCRERGNTVDPDLWFDHYESNGWRVGRNPMKSWKSAVRTWEKSRLNGNGNGHATPTPARGDYSALETARRQREAWEREQKER